MEPAPIRLSAFVDGATPTGFASCLSGVGVVIYDDHGELMSLARPAGPTLTIAYLEHLAILSALEIAREIGVRHITVYCDSTRVVNRIVAGCALRHTAEIRGRVRRLLAEFCEARVVAVSGDDNERAHGLARTATYSALDQITVRAPEEEVAK